VRARRGFTLVELVVVVSILAFLTAMVASVLRGVRHRVRTTECAHGLRQVWTGLSEYAQDNYFFPPPGETSPRRLPALTAGVLAELLDGRIDLLYCRTYPLRAEHLGAWREAVKSGDASHGPRIGYLYLAGARYEGWDVPNEALPDGFRGARAIDSVGNGASGSAETVWMADVAWCTTPDASGRNKARNWALTSHPPQRVVKKAGRKDYRLPDGANVLFEGGHVVFRSFQRLRPRLIRQQKVFYW
jgi:prepilin-type N-terminal cleavage/methylation domain-containing protein